MRPLVALSLLLAACAGGGGSAPAPVLAILAGDMRGAGAVDGTGATARFNVPADVTTDPAGNVYVADYSNHTIRRITPAGVVTTLAGTPGIEGAADGAATVASFSSPNGIAADRAGNVYVADSDNHTIRKITPAGVVSTFAGRARVRGSLDGTGTAACFDSPRRLAVDSAGNVYVADSGNNTIRKITPDGRVTTLAGMAGVKGSADGTGAAARFDGPEGIATDSAGNVYVGDSNFVVRKITPAGLVTTLAGTAGVSGSTDGIGAAARFGGPTGLATDSAGNVYMSDDVNSIIRKITPGGIVTTLAGTAGVSGSTDGTGAAARFLGLGGIAADAAGNVYVADLFNYAVRKITPAGVVTTLAGTARLRGSSDGTGTAARFNEPGGVAADNAGNVYLADHGNHTIRRITSGGTVTTLAGTAGIKGSVDGNGPAARFASPVRVATDAAGNIYVADTGNSTIRKITPAGVVTTLAGKAGVQGSIDGTGAEARFYSPTGVATDSAGNVYVADSSNENIRKITPAGAVTTLAGTAGVRGSTDGTGAAARFNIPLDVATDSAGNVYVADYNNKTIRKITPAGEVTTLAGSPGVRGSTDGTGPAARFYEPEGLAVDSAGNVYVADRRNHTIRKITPAGVVTTIAGAPGVPGFAQGGLPGRIGYPVSVAVSGTSLYITLHDGVAVVRNRP